MENKMPELCRFFGIIIKMYFFDTDKHKLPHIHVEYSGQECVISVPEGNILAGKLPRKQLIQVQAWISIHEDELMEIWKKALAGKDLGKIDPLR